MHWPTSLRLFSTRINRNSCIVYESIAILQHESINILQQKPTLHYLKETLIIIKYDSVITNYYIKLVDSVITLRLHNSLPSFDAIYEQCNVTIQSNTVAPY